MCNVVDTSVGLATIGLSALKSRREILFYEYRGPFFVPARLHGYRARVGNLKLIETRRRRFLMEIHFEAMDQLGEASQLILYAKAFDLARDLLPGIGNSKKKAALPASASSLRTSLDWLGKISNSRLETRHVASKGKLLPRMNATERADFVQDADLVIRAVVENELGIPVITLGRHS